MIVGTAGHIDHGKTSLVRALTGVDADRLKEEKARGITIDLGFAYMPAGDGVIGFVDVPGHERLVHNMLAGASGIDFALLVVAADDGPMPQTREHLAILDLLGLTRGLVALTKADLVDPDRLAAARNETANALIGTGLDGAEIVAVSSATGAGVAALRARLEAAAAERSARPAGAPFRLAVDRSFTLPGAGTVVTGTVLAGSVAPGDHLVASPSGLAVRVRGLHAQNRVAERGRPGDRCALNLAGDGVSKGALRRGDMIVAPALHAPTDRIDARLRVLASEARPIGQWLPVHLHHGAAEVAARVVLLGDPIAPGRRGPRPARPRPARRRRRPATASSSATPAPSAPSAAAPSSTCAPPPAAAARPSASPSSRPTPSPTPGPRSTRSSPGRRITSTPTPSPATAASRRTAFAARPDIVRIESRAGPLALSRATADRLGRALAATLEDFHAENPDLVGIGMERLRTSLEPRLPAPAFQALLQAEARAGRLALDGAWVRLAGHEVRLSPEDEVLWEEAQPLHRRRRALPPAAGPRPRRRARPRRGRGPPPLQAPRPHGPRARGRPRPFLPARHRRRDGGDRRRARRQPSACSRAAQFRDRLDNGRKVAIQILEFLDRHGVTMRRGDLRRINARRLDLFPRDGAEQGGEASPVGRPDFKSGRGRETVPGGFDSHSLPPLEPGTA